MKIFGFPLSPFVRKVAVAATEKGLAFEWEPSNPQAPTEEFARISPFRKIPALADGNFCIADSTAMTGIGIFRHNQSIRKPRGVVVHRQQAG